MQPVVIIPYTKEYQPDFYRLNLEWLKLYFEVEPHDEEMLSKPELIIEAGGYIYLAKYDNEIVGTVALVPSEEGFELSKMSVTSAMQGKGVSKLLMEAVINKAKELNAAKIILYSNTILVPAITLYRKFGFVEKPLKEETTYQRTNIKMELQIQ